MSEPHYDAARHYDRVTDAWSLLLGDELHYGVFRRGDEELSEATRNLTSLMLEAAAIEAGNRVLDVGCGTGAPACTLAEQHGATVVGITTSQVGVERARARAATRGLTGAVSFEHRDGMDNGFPDSSFDRVWVLESSHLMRDRARLVHECARVLRSRGRMALCDVVLRRDLPFDEVRRLRRPLTLLRAVFGDARMETLGVYRRLAEDAGLVIDAEHDLTTSTRPTFDRWRRNADRHRDVATVALGCDGLAQFVEACDVLERFWDDGTLGYGLIAAAKL